MEGALPSVVGGLTGVPLVAVPTSVGLRRLVRRGGRPAGDAQLVRARRHRGQHRQRVRRRRVRRAGGASGPVTRPSGSTPRPAPAATCCSARCSAPACRSRRSRPRSTRSPPSRSRCGSRRCRRNGFAATRCHVEVADSVQHRSWRDVRGAAARGAARRRRCATSALRVFERLAVAEGSGARPRPARRALPRGRRARRDRRRGRGLRGVRSPRRRPRSWSRPVAVGSGSVRGAHGTLPVPPPAVAALLTGVPSYAGPPGAPGHRALHARPAPRCSPRWRRRTARSRAMTTAAVGVGAGGRDPEGHANVLRLLVGAPVATDTGPTTCSSSRPTSTTSTRGSGPT